jgi:hypothetical protein
MSWAAVGPGGGVPLTGVAFGVGAGVTFAVAVGEGERVGSRITPAVADGAGEPLGAVVDPRAVSDGDADGVLEQPARSRTSRKTPDRFIEPQRRGSASSRDAAYANPD